MTSEGSEQSPQPGSGLQPSDPSRAGDPTPTAAVPTPGTGLGSLVDIQVLAAMLRNDRTDVASYTRVLSGALGDALPAGMVEVEYQRSLGDRMAGRPGKPVRLTIRGSERELELAEAAHGTTNAQIRKVVGGVVISRKQVGIDEWVQQFAAELAARASENAAARQALATLLGM